MVHAMPCPALLNVPEGTVPTDTGTLNYSRAISDIGALIKCRGRHRVVNDYDLTCNRSIS